MAQPAIGTEIPDPTLVTRAQRYERDALASLCDRSLEALYRMCSALAGSAEVAESLADAALAKALDRLPSFDGGPAAFHVWLLRTAAIGAARRRSQAEGLRLALGRLSNFDYELVAVRIFGEVDVDHLAPAISAQPASLRAWLVAALREVDGRSGIGWGYDLRAFDAAVDDVIDGADPAQAAAHVSAPADAPALLKLVSGLRGLAGDSTPEDVATRLRTSFLAAAADRQAQWVHRHHAVATVPGVQRRRYPSRTGTVLTLVIAAVLAVVVGGVLAVLSSFADPASLLYPVKRSSEATLVAVSLDPVDRAQLEIKLAQTRAREAEDMAGRGDGDRAAAAVDDRFRLLRAAARDLVSTSVHDARWRAARDRLFRESDVAMTTVDTDLQAGGQTRSAQDVERLVADYQRDRKTLESQLGRPSPQQGPPAATPPPPVPAPSS